MKPGPHRALAGCPWIFRGELLPHDPAPNGTVVAVTDVTGRFVGRGFYSQTSQIAVRVVSWSRTVPVDATLIRDRLAVAVAGRRRWGEGRDAMRLVNSEADGLPGLVVDRLGPMLVMQVLSAGLVPFQEEVVATLAGLETPEGIYERGDVPVRSLEGLPREDGVRYGRLVSPTFLHEGDISFEVDVVRGQKTGHFLDQSENRRRVAAYAAGREAADVFCHTGGFALHARRAGAQSVVGVDVDGGVLEVAARNAARSGMDDITWEQANAFDWLRQAERDQRRFDLVVLDPPAFTKSRAAVPGALRGYKEINLRAAKILRPGGMLITCSCSYHVSLDAFIQVVGEAAHDAHRALKIVEVRGQAPDHPIHPMLPESRYLKCLVASVE